MFRRQAREFYRVPLASLTASQVDQQILLTLQRMERVLRDIERGMLEYTDAVQKANDAVAARINANTEALASIHLPQAPNVSYTFGEPNA